MSEYQLRIVQIARKRIGRGHQEILPSIADGHILGGNKIHLVDCLGIARIYLRVGNSDRVIVDEKTRFHLLYILANGVDYANSISLPVHTNVPENQAIQGKC